MSDKVDTGYRETVQRYCHVIGKNTTLSRTRGTDACCYECSNRHICEKNGGCKNASFNLQDVTKNT